LFNIVTKVTLYHILTNSKLLFYHNCLILKKNILKNLVHAKFYQLNLI